MHCLDANEMLLQRTNKLFRQGSHTILATLAISHDNLPVTKIDILDSKAQRLQQKVACGELALVLFNFGALLFDDAR